MKKLRLLLFKDCNKHCEGCCNQYWDLDNLPVCKSFKEYDEILLTGGEPMLKPELVINTIKKIRKENSTTKIYMYTAQVYKDVRIFNILHLLDGITITLHEQSDAYKFLWFNSILNNCFNLKNKSLRLNIFKNVDFPTFNLKNWKIKDNMIWDKNCPLPEYEVLMKL